jgi:hypothetical protein
MILTKFGKNGKPLETISKMMEEKLTLGPWNDTLKYILCTFTTEIFKLCKSAILANATKYSVAQFVETLCCKAVGRNFVFRWGHCGFSICTIILCLTQPLTGKKTRSISWM